MDWSQIEDDVKLRTQRALFAVTEFKCSRENGGSNPTFNSYLDSRATENDAPSHYSQKTNRRATNGSHDIKLTPLENGLQELRNMTVLQGKKVLSIENILSAYGGICESSTEAQSSLIMRVDSVEKSSRDADKYMQESNRERNALNIHVKSLAGKVSSLEDNLDVCNRSYATKESFSQLLDSTVNEIKGIGVVVSQSSIKSAQSISLTEALIQAIHRMRGHLDVFAGDDADSGSPLSLDFLSSLTGERQREQIIRLLTGSLLTSVTSVARDVVTKEAENICNSVNGMLKTLSVQLLQSVDEASQCLAVAARLDNQQGSIMCSVRDHAERARDLLAQQIGGVMESVGEALEDFSTTQRSMKGDFDSFDSELSQQRKSLYLELGLIKDAQTALRNTCNMLEKKYIAESSTLDNRFMDLDVALRSLKAIVKAENEGGVERRANSEFSKEVITALVTEVILADTVERRNREAVEAAQAISSKQSGEAAALGELSEIRMTAQLQSLKSEFAAEIAQMSSRLLQKEAELLEVGKRNATEAESWRVVMDNRILELHAQAAVQAASHMDIVQQLQAAIDKKTCDLASAMEAMKTSNEKHLLASAQSVDKVEVNPVAESLSELQREVKRLTDKVEMVQKVVAEVSTVSIHMGDELTSTRSITNNNHDTISKLSVTVMKLDGVMGVKPAPDESVTLQSIKLGDQIKKLEDRVAVVAATGLANKQEGDKNIERRALTISNQLSKLSAVVDVLQSSFLKAEQSYSSAMSKSTSSIERIEALHNDVEIRLKVLHRSVDQQAEQSSALLMTGRAAPEETRVKVHAEAIPYVEAISNGATSIGVPGPGSGPPSCSIENKKSLMPLKDIMVAATPHSKLTASAFSAPDLLLRLSTANAQEAHAPAPPLGTISYGSSITNSFTSTRQCSASSLKISIGLDEDDEEECQAPGTLFEESDLPHPRGSDDSDTDDDDDDDEGDNSFDGSDLAVSPSKAAASNSSPLGRRFHRGNTATLPSNAPGKSERSSRSTHLAFSKAGSSSNDDNEFDSTKDIGSSVKLNRSSGPDKSSKPTLTPSAASALLRTVDSNKVPLSGVDLRDSGRDDDCSSREEDDDDDDDDDFSEDNSMAASDDPIANVGKALDRRINTSVAAPQSLVRHRSEDAVDPSSAPDASTSSPALALAKVGTHSLVHFDPLDPTGTGICSPRRSTLAPLSPLRSTLLPLSSSLVSPPVKAGLLSSYNASDNTDKLRPDAISINHGPLSLLAAPLASPRVSSLLPTSAVPAAGPSLVPSPAIRPSPSVVSGSLLSTGRRAVDSTGTSANPPVTHIPPAVSAVAVMQPVASTYRLNSGPGPGNALATHLQKPIDERDKEDENSNLDFDTSSWDEEDEAEDSS